MPFAEDSLENLQVAILQVLVAGIRRGRSYEIT